MGCIKDLSRGGMRCGTNKKLQEGALLNIKIMVSTEEAPVFLIGEVKWTKDPQNNQDFEYLSGIKFFKIDNFDRSRILNSAYIKWLAANSAA